MKTMNRSEINLRLGDSLEAMKLMPDNAYDLAIVDVPYGINMMDSDNASRVKLAKPKDYKKINDSSAPNHKYFEQLFRVSKNQIIFGANHFMSRLYIAAPMMKDIDSPCWIVWDKNNSGDFADCELAWTSFGSAVRKFKFTWNGMLQGDMKNKEVRIHSCQKPVKLYEWLLTNYAKEGDKILDTHGGSMSIALACHNLKYDLDLWELDEDYYKAGVKRFEQHKKQLQLF
tara:strand:+ start:61 stop:747 length:687 start_codon:yes stop_codon:yes gene_type:complete